MDFLPTAIPMKVTPRLKRARLRKTRTVVTSIRPPQVIADAVVLLARERNCSRCRVIRDLLDAYLDAETTKSSSHDTRSLYASLRCKLADRHLPFACDARRLRTYRLAARMLRARSLAGLLSFATLDVIGAPAACAA